MQTLTTTCDLRGSGELPNLNFFIYKMGYIIASCFLELFKVYSIGDFPGGAVVKNPPANAGDTGSSPGPGRSHMPRSN